MSICVFEKSVINLTWNKQHVFFILVHSDFYRIPLPDHVYTRTFKNKILSKVNKSVNFEEYKPSAKLQTFPFEKWRKAEYENKSNDNGELQEQKLVFIL